MKKTKNELRKDLVVSNSFHVGIELELKTPSEGGSHDDDACYDSRRDSQQDYLNDLGAEGILRDYCDLSRDQARSMSSYFNAEEWINDYMDNWSDDGCQGDCGYEGGNENVRDEMTRDLRRLTDNTSFKVVSDSSIETDSDETDTEVCWNYFASKETIRDNERILKYLTDKNCNFDKSCGLHINLNNYLKLDARVNIPTEKLSFLFSFVAGSRASSSFCNTHGISRSSKYSMLYEQGDRVEFRFFSPTLDAEKLNHYVTLANVVYRRLCGKFCKLPKKTSEYFLEKMTKVNGLSLEVAKDAIRQVNTLSAYASLIPAESEVA